LQDISPFIYFAGDVPKKDVLVADITVCGLGFPGNAVLGFDQCSMHVMGIQKY